MLLPLRNLEFEIEEHIFLPILRKEDLQVLPHQLWL